MHAHHICSLLLIISVFSSCSGQEQSSTSPSQNPIPKESFYVPFPPKNSDQQIAEYIRNIHQDHDGKLWFGTNGYGVAHFDGDSVSYFSNQEGFEGQQITGITEDLEHNLWFATDQGVVKYEWSSHQEDSKRFTNYTDQQYFGGQRFWSILADSKGIIWAGAARGIYRFDGQDWKPFALPYPEEITGEFITAGTSWSISEDHTGNIWFSTNGYGAFKYDGQSFTQYSSKDGLTDDRVDVIMEDRSGNIWFGTRFGGVSRYDGTTFTNYTSKDSIGNDEVCALYEDKAGNIWFSAEGYGVYRYDPSASRKTGGKSFTNYSQEQGLGVLAVQTIFEDREGRLWVGGGGGLYQFDGKSFVHVGKNGPWTL